MNQPTTSNQTNSRVKKGAAAISAAALLAIAGYEGFRADPYRDIGGVWTDGYGNTHAVVPGQRVTREQALQRLEDHAKVFTAGVMDCLDHEPTYGQLGAFVSLAYNAGLGGKRADGSPGKDGFCRKKNGRPSTIVARFNAGDELGACLAMLQWSKVGETTIPGLFNRRWSEYQECVAAS